MKFTEIEQLSEMYKHYGHKCFIPGCDCIANQRAHILGQTKANYLKFGKEIIDNPLNWLPACCLNHNGLIDIGTAPERQKVIAGLIKNDDRKGIEKIVLENIQRKKGKPHK